jgi:predicted amidohydrolase
MGGLKLSDEESQTGVERWRTRYSEIAEGWKSCGAALADIVRGVKRPVDPWGLVTARASEGEGLAMAEFDEALLAKVRRNLPALQHRKL